jgi:hypothetical protein
MDSRNTLDTTLSLIIQYGIVAVMYFVIFQYRLPYLQTLAVYAGLSMIPRIYSMTLQRSILKGDRSLPNWSIGTDVMLLVILIVVPAFVVPGMALYRFSGLEAFGLLAVGFIVSNIVRMILLRI